MSPIPAQLANICGVAPETNPVTLIEAIALGQVSALDGLLNLETNQQAVLASLESVENYQLKIFESIKPLTESKFCQVRFQATATPVLIGSFGIEQSIDEYENEAPLPTELEQLVFWCLLNPGSEIFAHKKQTTNGEVLDWRAHLRGRVIVAEPVEFANEQPAMAYVHSLFGLKTPQNSRAQAPYSTTASASGIFVDVPANSVSRSNAMLMFEAVSEVSPKWRSFSLYRVLENAYLDNIRDALIRRFDSQPKIALKEATNQLGSELMQLIALAESADLRGECVQWDIAFEGLLTSHNSYAEALDREAQEDQSNYGATPDKRYKKALLRLYKLRCSIAHAGTSSVIYEKHLDADAAAIALIPNMERIVHKLLKLQVTA